MLKPHLHTTPLIPPGERQPLKVLPVAKPTIFRAFWIFRNILHLFFCYFKLKVSRRYTAKEWASEVRHFVERMGGIWIKAGQVLAMRNDLFSPEFCNELGNLQDRAFAYPSELAIRTVREQLGRPIEDVFDQFDVKPFAAASLCQVHKARLRENGCIVAVKVRRPFAVEFFRHDLWWLSRFFGLLQMMDVMDHFHWDEMLKAVRDMMEEELDYRYEATHMRDFRKTLKKHKVYVPRVFFQYSSASVLVMEFLEAVFMSEWVKVSRTDPARLAAWIKENDLDPKKIARRLFESQLRQIYEDLLFHGDLHPGNIIVLRENRLAFVDFGNVGFLDQDFAKTYDQYLHAFSANEMSTAADLYLVLAGRLSSDIDLAQVKKELIAAFHRHQLRSRMRNLPFQERSLAGNAAELSRIAGAYRFEMNWNLLKMGRALGAIDQNIGVLNPDIDYNKETARYIQKAAERKERPMCETMPRLLRQMELFSQALKPTLLSRAMQFGAWVSHGARLASMALGLLARGVWVTVFVALWVYLYQHHFGVVASIHTSRSSVVQWIEAVPRQEKLTWVGIGIVLVLLGMRLAGLAKNMIGRPARRPGERP